MIHYLIPTRLLGALLIFLWLTGFSTPAALAAGTTGNIAGSLTDQSTGKALVGATVSAGGVTASSDAGGKYILKAVPKGRQTVSATMSAYMPASTAVTVVGNVTVTAANLTLTPFLTKPGATIPWGGKNQYLAGNNYAWQNYGTDFGTGGWGKFTDWNKIRYDFESMRVQGVTTVRWWVFADGRYAPDFNVDGSVTGLDAQFFTDVDTALQIAHDNHILLLPCLVDFYMFGGVQSANNVSGGGHSAMIINPAFRQSYLDNALKPFLQHVAASPYKSSIIAYDVCNEPEFEVTELRSGPITLAQMRDFARMSADYIHQYGGGAYATLGSAADFWVGNWTGLGLDFYQMHWYPNFTGRGLPTYASLNLDRPCIIGEFPTNNGDYGFGSKGYFSAQWFLDTIYAQGYAGALGWGFQDMDQQSNWSGFVPVFMNWIIPHVPPLRNAATFVKTDALTQGNWKGVYGRDGYLVINDTVNYPGYMGGWGNGVTSYTWDEDTANSAALQKPAANSDRIAACWYALDSFFVDVNLKDGQTHKVSLYCVDYDQGGRSQSIDVIDADTNAVLSTQNLNSFTQGVYLIWNVKGHVKFRVTRTGPYSALLSGLFFN